MKKNPVPDTIGLSVDTREDLRRASQSVTLLNIPGYQLTREIGRGSFGTVWQAIREKTGQTVAVKIVEDSETLNWEYFRRELDFLRELEEHPNTLTILDAQLENDPPYIVMPLAEGGSLEESQKREEQDPKVVESWLAQMAEALSFIHRKGVIHCDLKPSNVLLSSAQAIRIADLGQARRAGHGVALGTIGFMAPEQCADSSKASPSVSWDVYGFGATAYWLLTGRIPRLEESESLTLEAYVENFSKRPLTPVRKLNPNIDPELSAIVEACLEQEPQKRIPSLDAVLDDFEHRKNNRPLLCRKPWTTRYVVTTALRRRTVQALLVTLLAILLGSAWAWHESNQNRFLTYSSTGIHAHESGRFEEAYLDWLEALDYRPRDATTMQRLFFMPLDRIYPHAQRVTDIELLDEDRNLVTASADGEVAIWDNSNGQKIAVLKHPDVVSRLSVSADGKWMATGSWDGKARIFELSTKELKSTLNHKSAVTGLEFSSDGALVVTGDLEGRLHLWETISGAPLPLDGPPANSGVQQVLARHPSLPVLAALTDFTTAALWDLKTGKRLPHLFRHAKEINKLAFTPNGKNLITASDDNLASLWDTASGERLRQFPHDSRVNTLFVLSDTEFVTGSADGNVTVWDIGKDGYRYEFPHRRPVRSLQANAERTLLAVGTGESDNLWSDTEANGTVIVWDLARGYQVAGPWPHDGPVEQVRFSDKDRLVLSASGSARQTTAVHPGSVRAWRHFLPEVVEGSGKLVGQSPEGANLSEVLLDNDVKISHGENVTINQYALFPDKSLVATASEDQTVRLWDSSTGESLRAPILLNAAAKAVAFNADGSFLATASAKAVTFGAGDTPDGESKEPQLNSGVRIWDVDSNYPISPLLTCPGTVIWLDFAPDSSKLTARTEVGTFSWDLAKLDSRQNWRANLEQRLWAKLDKKGSVVALPELSASVMTQKLP